jgi:phage terminase large subunit-like protein
LQAQSRASGEPRRRNRLATPSPSDGSYSAVALAFAKEAAGDRKGRKHCKWVRLAAQRHLDDLKRKNWDYEFRESDAEHVCNFIANLPHVEGSWETKTISLEPAQVFVLCVVFGWRRKADGLRRFSSVYIEMARKGAKSTLTAGIALYCLCCEGEVGPQVIIGATTGEQAQKVFKPAKQMVERTSQLRDAFGVEAWARSITCQDSGGYIQTINAKSSTQDGWNPHVGILDELHAHKDRGLYDVIRSAFGARKNPLLWIITTAGYNDQGVCYEQRVLVTKILEGIVPGEHYFGVIFTLDDGDSPLDETKWIKANPMLGVTPTLESMRSYAKEAIASPDSMGEFQTKRCNIWTSAKNGWVNMELWKRGAAVPASFDGLSVFAAIDLASVSDITARVMVARKDGRLLVRGRYWVPERMVEERDRRASLPYKRWVQEGWLQVTPGDVCDYEFVEADLDRDLKDNRVEKFAYDPWNARDIVNRLVAKSAPMVEFRQGIPSFAAPMQELARLITSGMIDHGGDPVLAWMASNVVARRDTNNNVAPDRKNSQDKIDGFVALAMAVGVMLGAEDTTSVYETRGILVI